MHSQLSANWTADWGALPEAVISTIEANYEEFDLPAEKKVEIWANIFQEAGFTVTAIQGFYHPDFPVSRQQWQQDRFSSLATHPQSSKSYWLEVDGYLIDPTAAHNLNNYYPYWSWPSQVFDDLMWQEDWQPLS